MSPKRWKRQRELTLERKNNFLQSVQSKYVLNFMDCPDEKQRFTNLKMYLHTEKIVHDPSHTYSYVQLRKNMMELNLVFWIGEGKRDRAREDLEGRFDCLVQVFKDDKEATKTLAGQYDRHIENYSMNISREAKFINSEKIVVGLEKELILERL